MTNPMQPLDPIPAPPNITPADTPSSPLYGSVTPHGQGPAPYDIQAPQADLTGVFSAAGRDSGGEENNIYPSGPRQAEARTMLESPAGFGSAGYDIDAGATAGWQASIDPGA